MAIETPPSSKEVLELLEATLPPFFPRSDTEKVTYGLFSGETLANLNYKGRGPKFYYLGKKCVIGKDEFLKWLKETYYEGVDHGDTGRDDDVPEAGAGEPQQS